MTTKIAALCLALAGCGIVYQAPKDAGAFPDSSALADGGLPDAGEDGGLRPPDSDGSRPPEDAGNDSGIGDGELLEDAGADSGPLPDPDAGILELDAGAGADSGHPDSGPPDSGPPDSGPSDSGPPDTGPPDTGPPPCLPDVWEPNDAQASARLLATVRSNAGAWNIDGATFAGADPDWYRIDVRRATTRPTRVRATTPPGAMAWLRVRYVCASGVPTSCSGTRLGTACESLGLGWVQVTVSCPDLSGDATFYVEATRPSAAACGYSPTFELEPG